MDKTSDIQRRGEAAVKKNEKYMTKSSHPKLNLHPE